ncbi:hypothetical protein LJC46_09010 [Desulfovibrio sp. OttesenSCG-928-G15]|nr:hypothetical protein [Desulfovibrio sp. OttesenSCG-928-G15]
MKYFFMPVLVLLLAVCAYAQGNGIAMLVIDKAPEGANVRGAPDGAVIKTLPVAPGTDEELDTRRVTAMERKGEWFRVRLYDETIGWMHTSVLGTCASATEDGDPPMYTKPDELSPPLARLKQGTPLRLLEMRGSWVKVETADSAPKKTGWMMEHTLLSNPHNNCWEK